MVLCIVALWYIMVLYGSLWYGSPTTDLTNIGAGWWSELTNFFYRSWDSNNEKKNILEEEKRYVLYFQKQDKKNFSSTFLNVHNLQKTGQKKSKERNLQKKSEMCQKLCYLNKTI